MGCNIADPHAGFMEGTPEDSQDMNLVVFRAIQNHVQQRRFKGEQMLRKYPQLGLTFSNSEFQEVEALVK